MPEGSSTATRHGSRTTGDPSAAPGPDEQVVVAILLRKAVDLSRLLTPAVASQRPCRLDGVSSELRRAVRWLEERGFRVSGVGRRTISLRGPIKAFEEAFRTKVLPRVVAKPDRWSRRSLFAKGIDWRSHPELEKVVESIDIQRSTRYSAGQEPSAQPPATSAAALDVSVDVPALVNGAGSRGPQHQGEGVAVAMVDTGFDVRHGFFRSNGFKPRVRLVPWATNPRSDPIGHGTAMCANFFVVAPKAILLGVKVHNDDDPVLSGSTLEGIQRALASRPRPRVISLSSGVDLRDDNGRPIATVDGDLGILAEEIRANIDHPDSGKRIVFVCSAGNGELNFEAQIPEVISVGGAFSDRQGQHMSVSANSSSFTSAVFPPRFVPDVCGVLGLLPQQTSIMLPVPRGSEWDDDRAPADGTTKTDGWAVFGGTSATTPQVAAVCAILLEAFPDLSPAQVKAVICKTARPVLKANGVIDPRGGGGVVDAGAALQEAATLFP